MGKWEGGGEDDDGGDGEGWGMGWWDVFVFSGGGEVDFMCAYANGQAVQGNWLKVILVKVLSKNCQNT